MKATFVKYLLVIILVSCKASDKQKEISYAGFTEKDVPISTYILEKHEKDTLAILSIKIPERLDTFYQWQRYADAVRSNTRRYRFADSRYSVREERPEIENYLRSADSLYQLTISYITFIPASNDSILYQLTSSDTTLVLEQIRKLEFNSDSSQIIFKKYFKPDSHSLLIAAYRIPSIYRENEMKLTLLGVTRIKKRQLIIRAECDAKDTTGFIESMYKSFLSIRIKENP